MASDVKKAEAMAKYLSHSMNNNIRQGQMAQIERTKGRPLSIEEQLKEFQKQPVCLHCESVAYRHSKGTAICPKCGWHGKSVTLKEYIESKLYR